MEEKNVLRSIANREGTVNDQEVLCEQGRDRESEQGMSQRNSDLYLSTAQKLLYANVKSFFSTTTTSAH